MKYVLLTTAVILGLAAAPAVAQNAAVSSSADSGGSGAANLPYAGSGDTYENLPNTVAGSSGAAAAGKAVNSGAGSSATSAAATGPEATTSAPASSSSSTRADTGATASADIGSPPSRYPVCRTRSQDRCRVPSQMARAHGR